MKADIARTVIIIAVIFCFSYTVQGLVRSVSAKFAAGGLSEGVIVLYASGSCEGLERALFSALAAEPALVAIIAADLDEDGKRLCNAAQSYGSVMLFESPSDAAGFIAGQFEKGT